MDFENRERPLCYIVVIKRVLPIQGADKVCIAEINGWQCVIKNNEFEVGDLAIYYTIDSIPDFTDPNTELVRSRGGRVKTIKLRGVVSQGLLAPLNWLESRGHDIGDLKEGEDVTERMGVTKYINEEEADQYITRGSGIDDFKRSPFPSCVPKTEENRLQNCPRYLEYISHRKIVITRKEDGCSATFIFQDGIFKVCGRNFVWEEPSNASRHHYLIAEKYNIECRLREFGRNIALQGEIIGPKINANRMRMTEHEFKVFNIWDFDQCRYLLWSEVTDICILLNIPTVPVVYSGDAVALDLCLPAFLDMAERQQYGPNVSAEGIVVKTDDDDGGRISFKVISNKYLLKHKL